MSRQSSRRVRQQQGDPPRSRRLPGRAPKPQQRLAPRRPELHDLYPGWKTLMSARKLVGRFVEVGWIDKTAISRLDNHISRLQDLTRADGHTVALGGQHARRIYEQIDEVTGLLVALADAAVEHQAALVDTSSVPATLLDAQERLRIWTAERLALEEPDRPS